MAIDWEKLEGASNMWVPQNEGDELIGEVISIEEGSYGKQYTLRKEDGEEVRPPSLKVLQNRLADVQIGDLIKIIYEGEEPPAVKGQNPTKMYSVFRAKED